MPAQFFVRFFKNHGMLSVDDRPTWRVIKGGSSQLPGAAGCRTSRAHPPGRAGRGHQRFADHVTVKVRGQEAERFDHVFIACHSDQALAMLKDPSDAEREVLGAIGYQENEAVLHTDHTVLPKRRLAWAAWNYHLLEKPDRPAAVTYNMNILQGLASQQPFCVTLNHTDAIDPATYYRHAIPTATRCLRPEAVAAQARQRELNQGRRTSFCGAYWRNGFHEDGVVSALAALEHFATDRSYAQRNLSRAS